MKNKGIILLSTIMVFILATVVSFVWLFKIRHIEIDVVAEASEEIATYDSVNDLVESVYKGKSYFGVDEDEIIELISKDPYLNVTSVKKSMPDRIEIKVERRKERFAILYNGEYYVTDSEYYFLKKVSNESLLDESIIKITLTNVTINEDTLVLGKKIGAENDVLVGRMTDIFAGFTDGLNLVKSVTVMGSQNWIRFNTKTGVVIEFSFSPSDPKLTEDQKEIEAHAIVMKAGEVEESYHLLTESQKRNGFLLVYTKANKTIAIEHVNEHKA